MKYSLFTLELFLCASKNKSLAKTAMENNLVVSAVSKRISDLEKILGLKLFFRKNSGVELTKAGQEMLKHSESIIESIKIMDKSLKKFSLEKSGIVNVAANSSSITQFLPHDLATFTNLFPKIEIKLKEKTSKEVISCVKEYSADIGIFSEHVENINKLKIIDYKRDKLVLVVPQDHDLANYEKVKITDFIKYEMVGLEKGSSLQAELERQAEKKNMRIKIKVKTVSFDGVRGMVESGLGIAVLPSGAVEPYINSSSFKMISIDEKWASRSIKIAVQNDQEISEAGQLLLNHLLG